MFNARNLDKLVAAGIITPTQKLEILHFERESNQGLFSRLLMRLGVLAIGLGVIALVAANWFNVSDEIKLILMALLLGGSGGLAYNWQNKGLSERAEKMLAFLVVLVGAAIGLIIQVFQLSGGKWYDVLGIWCAISLPVLFTAKKKYAATIWSWLFLIWVGGIFAEYMERHSLYYTDVILAFMALFVLVALGGLVLERYVPKFCLGEVLKRNALFSAYIFLALYIICFGSFDTLLIAVAILMVSSAIYKYFRAGYLIRRNIKFGVLVVLMFYFQLADVLGLFSSGIGLILVGVGVIYLVKYQSKLIKFLQKGKKNA